MRHVAIASLCVLFLACSKEQAGVPVLINYTSNFTKGCFIVRVYDAAKPDVELDKDEITELPGRAEIKVAVLRKEGWGEKVNFVVEAHEQTCDGPEVDKESRELDLSGEGRAETVQLSLETPDGDGDGYVPTANGGTDCDDTTRDITQRRYYRDGDADGVGAGAVVFACNLPAGHALSNTDCNDAVATIRPGGTEACNEVDDNCDGRTDEGYESEKQWYLDNDSDTYGRIQVDLSCTAPSMKHVKRSGDCRDDVPTVNPGAQELCNDQDENCNEEFDEGLGKGDSCTDNESCAGVRECDAARMGTICKTPPRATYFRDVDMDGEGGSTTVSVCAEASMPVGTVATSTDCDDADADAKTMGSSEVCDGLDNNCAGGVDEGLTCNGALRRVSDAAASGADDDWRVVATGSSGYPVWIAGLGGKLIRRTAAGVAFDNFSHNEGGASCGDYDWYAAWVRSDGHVLLAGEGGRVARHDGSGCHSQDDIPGEANLTGMVGFGSGGGTRLYLVNELGDVYFWAPGSAPSEVDDTAHIYYAIHGLDAEQIFVGGRTNGKQHIVEYDKDTLGTPVEHTLAASVDANVTALWMNSSSLAYGVGDLSAIWRWTSGTNWTTVTPPTLPTGGTVNFTSVAMPSGRDILYVVDKGPSGTDGQPGRLHRRTPAGWARAPAISPRNASEASSIDVSLHDIAMTSTGDFWMVGNDGRVYHYPEP
ncbi:putative metal-binding motif-containing protein [Pyxidicoccus xibeiensis]|uniref:putative metal-binding motif-containing protein n=1 Tax=Pyxidicoccus xibeiensis TaxID=2906759 RepID=UPI0020A7CE66|nr:putative metal-binding motif-containing protein [Pyxidicoccus xibeiensis]MCP3136947.1 putative metal-binding motif-containing protein [Pyxidicoccus xibeiensis]